MSRNRLATLVLAAFAPILCLAQSYQTSFSEAKFDRANGPGTIHAGLEVDAASGAVSTNLPFGPGIGARGVNFKPMLSARFGPQLGISAQDEYRYIFPSGGVGGVVGMKAFDTVPGMDILLLRSFGTASFHPGSLDLGTMVSTLDRKKTTYSLPGGSGGRVCGAVPSGVIQQSVQTLLATFGFGPNESVGYLPGPTSTTIKTPFIQTGSDRSLVVGLRYVGSMEVITDEVVADVQQYPASVYSTWHFPRRMAVIQGDVAYEFHYVHHTYVNQVIPFLREYGKTQLYSGHYVITRIRNKFNERIDFEYNLDGIGYTATWSVNPAVKIRVEQIGPVSVAPGQPRLGDSRFNVEQATRIRISYLGLTKGVTSYLLDVAGPLSGTALGQISGGGPATDGALSTSGVINWDWNLFDAALHEIQPMRVYQEWDGAEIKFEYQSGLPSFWTPYASTFAWSVTPTVLGKVVFPTRTVSLYWDSYRYRMNYSPEAWGGVTSSSLPGRPAIAYGVTGISDSDGTQIRMTGYQRFVPQSNWNNYPVGSTVPDQWVDKTFYTAVTHPDGSVTVHRFVSPPDLNGTTGSEGMQNLAFIKTLECEVRYYAKGVDWQADLAVTSPVSSPAYRWVVKDRFDTRGVTTEPLPYPTRVRNWEKANQLLTIEESTNWDDVAFSWKASHKVSCLSSSPDLSVDYLSQAQKGTGFVEYPFDKGVYRRTDITFDPRPSDWLFARVKTNQMTTVKDSTGFYLADPAEAASQVLTTRIFHSSLDRVESVAVSNANAPTITTMYSYLGNSGLAAVQLKQAMLQSPGLVLSGLVGVYDYAYDGHGFMSSIKQRPNADITLVVGQTSDELGRPLTQTDVNGTFRTYDWDPNGRLVGITTSDGEHPTTFAYDPDNRGITVTRGAQKSVYRYNGFGELALIRRLGPDNAWSHKIFGYDLAGRNTGETIWLPGDGLNHEVEWVKSNLTRTVVTVTTLPDKTVCKIWGVDVDGNGICVVWQTIPGGTTTTTSYAIYAGSAKTYDGEGRVNVIQDESGVETMFSYLGPETTVPGITTGYVGPVRKAVRGETQVQWQETDAAGRVVRLVTPVTRNNVIQNLRTEYWYDRADRIREVRQYDEGGREQKRKWRYTSLGWLDRLEQPESGATTYSAFTVAGKPTVMDYNGRIVRTTPDWLGRPLTVTSDDGTVFQSYSYDTALNGLGRIAMAQDLGIAQSYSYGGVRKRLDRLITTTTIQATPQSFTQMFTYDAYGNRIGGSVQLGTQAPYMSWNQTYHDAAGVPNQFKRGSQPIVDMPWAAYDATSWSLLAMAFGNGASTVFSYETNQMRLASMKHLDGQMGVKGHWSYLYHEKSGNLIREYDQLRPDGSGSYYFDQYGYDELNRLVSAVVQSPSFGEQLQQFDYDAFGNRISSNIQLVIGWSGEKGSSTAYVAPSLLVGASDRLVVNADFTQGSAALFLNRIPTTTSTGLYTGASYDAQGNLLQIFDRPTSVSPISTSLTYDALGRALTTASSRTGLTEKYRYSSEGLRTITEEYSGTTLLKTKVNLYNDARQLVGQWEKVPSGSLVWKRDILYVGNKEVAEYDLAGMHITQVDHLGSPRFITGPTGQVEGIQKFLPFGELLESYGTVKAAKGFTNHEQTDSSGLIYMQARFYAPWYGRFLSPDPARDQHFEETQSWNIYSYVQNNPTMNTDPTGMFLNPGDFIRIASSLITQYALSRDTNRMAQPIKNPTASYKSGGRQFGAARDDGRLHAGADLLRPKGDTSPVYALKGGTVQTDPYKFYAGTYAVEVKNKDGSVTRYGEIGATVPADAAKGKTVAAGQQIGNLTPNTKDGNSMLHIEMYSGAESGSLTDKSNPGYQRRSDLINPTPALDTVYKKKEEPKKKEEKK